MQNLYKPIKPQKGAAIILMAFIIGLAATAYLVHTLDPQGLRAEQDKRNTLILAKAKEAIISYSISRFASGERPGDMPRPDYFAVTEAPNFNYDGDADGGCLNSAVANGLPQINNGANMRCLGRLPWHTIGMSISNATENDSTGSMPWYAVSANLVDPTCLKPLNPSIQTKIYSGYVCAGATLPHPWLTVRDSLGNIISNRVAVVLMMPNSVLTGQSRPTAPLNPVANYLDAITVPVGCAVPCVPGVYNNAGLNNEFILFNQAGSANTANDQLVYITIDELMSAVERRAAQEAALQLKKYYVNSSAVSANRFYPYAASLGDINNACVDTKLAGFIPILPAYANCQNAATCSTDFSKASVSFSLSSGTAFSSNLGACTRVAGSCKCTGAGNCRRGGVRFTCTAIGTKGDCQSTGSGSAGNFSFTYTAKTPDVTSTTGACSGGAGVVNCMGGIGKFSSPNTSCVLANSGVSSLPVWFTNNLWQNYIYYALSSDCTNLVPGCVSGSLTVGSKTNVHALVISSGAGLASTQAQPLGQISPSNSVADYLDSLVNTDGGTPPDPANIIFDATSKQKTSNYNDQTFIVAP